MSPAPEFRVGIDIGGTFTDIVFLASDGTFQTRKVSSTVDDYARAIADSLGEIFSQTDIRSENITEFLHGTTVASNAILEMTGACTGLITTEGFRDILELRTLRMPRLYDIELGETGATSASLFTTTRCVSGSMPEATWNNPSTENK